MAPAPTTVFSPIETPGQTSAPAAEPDAVGDRHAAAPARPAPRRETGSTGWVAVISCTPAASRHSSPIVIGAPSSIVQLKLMKVRDPIRDAVAVVAVEGRPDEGLLADRRQQPLEPEPPLVACARTGSRSAPRASPGARRARGSARDRRPGRAPRPASAPWRRARSGLSPVTSASATIVFTRAVSPPPTSTSTMKVPTSRIGSSRRIFLRSIRSPRASAIASAISALVTEPNSLPSSPARCWIVSTVFASSAAVSPARSAASLAALLGGLPAALRLLQRRLRGGLGELAGDQVVAQVAGRDVDRPPRPRRGPRRP